MGGARCGEGSGWRSRGVEGRSLGKGRGLGEFLPVAAFGLWRGWGLGQSSHRSKSRGVGIPRALEQGRCCHRLLVLGNVVCHSSDPSA